MFRNPGVLRMMANLFFVVTCLAGCALNTSLTNQPQPATGGRTPIPPFEHFLTPAVGTPMPYSSKMPPIELPSASGGALFLNGMDGMVRVVVSDTIATVPAGQGFLIVLPPKKYEFYIYGIVDYPVAKSEQIEAGKVRYVYLTPIGTGVSRFQSGGN